MYPPIKNLLILMCFALTLIACQSPMAERNLEKRLRPYKFEQGHMGTKFGLIFYAESDQMALKAVTQAFLRIKALNDICTDYDPNSELMRFCRTHNQWVQISPDLYAVLAQSQSLAKLTQGKFDVTIGRLIKLWRRSRRIQKLPTDKQLADAKIRSGYRHLTLKEENGKYYAKLAIKGLRIDLGGIAKGYAADQALKTLKTFNITRAMVDAGGDITAGDAPPSKAGWRFAIADISGKTGNHDVILKNASIATSGDLFRYVLIDQTRYSHILDPQTGLGLTGRKSVSVIAKDGMTADALATAASVMSAKDFEQLRQKAFPESGVFMITKEMQDESKPRRWQANWPGKIKQ